MANSATKQLPRLPFNHSGKVQTAKWQFGNCFVSKLPFSHLTNFIQIWQMVYLSDCFFCRIATWPFRLKLKCKRNLRYFENTSGRGTKFIQLKIVFVVQKVCAISPAAVNWHFKDQGFTKQHVTNSGAEKKCKHWIETAGFWRIVLTDRRGTCADSPSWCSARRGRTLRFPSDRPPRDRVPANTGFPARK